MELFKELMALADENYVVFHSAPLPTIDPQKILGVRVPVLRKFAKALPPERTAEFLTDLPHSYYDENMLHVILLNGISDFESCLDAVNAFLPYVDNWAVCDGLSPAVFRRHRAQLFPSVLRWMESPEEYTCRFGIGMLMRHYLDEDFQPEYLDFPADIHREEYYVRMMQAWFFATALAKQPDAALPYFRQRRLDAWVHNKAIQKARESYRVPPERKEELKRLKV